MPSDRFNLPLLSAGQAQKEMTVNEALGLLDLLVHLTIQEGPRNAPPAAPSPGSCWIVGTAPTGDWSGQSGAIAGWTADGWRWIAAREGMVARVVATGLAYSYQSGSWRAGELIGQTVKIGGIQVVGAQQPAIATPTGGTTIDAPARSSIASILDALRNHGLIASA